MRHPPPTSNSPLLTYLLVCPSTSSVSYFLYTVSSCLVGSENKMPNNKAVGEWSPFTLVLLSVPKCACPLLTLQYLVSPMLRTHICTTALSQAAPICCLNCSLCQALCISPVPSIPGSAF